MAAVGGFLVVVVVAVVIRLWGIGWGLPYAYHADEPDMVQRKSLNPGFYNYPPFFYYVEAGGQLAYFAVGAARGEFDSVDDISQPEMQTLGNGRLGNPKSLLTGRLISVALGVGAVAIVFVSIILLSGSMPGAIVGGALMALGPLAVRQSRFMTPDALATFFVAAVLGLSFLILRRGRTLDYVLAGFAVGLAGSSKYHVAIVAVAVVAAHVMRSGTGWYRDRVIYLAGVIAVGTFLVLSFVIFFDFSSFWAEFAWKQGAYTGTGGGGGESLWFYLGVVATEAGFLLLLIPIAFIGSALRREAGIAVGFAVVYLAVIAMFVLRFERHVLPALPAVAVAVGLGLSVLTSQLRGWTADRSVLFGRLVTAAITAILVAFAFGPMATTISDGDRFSSDERADVRAFVDALPRGSRVLVDAYSPFVGPETFAVTSTGFVATDGRDPAGYDYVTVAEQGSGRFLQNPDTGLLRDTDFGGRFADFCEIAFFPGPPWQRVLAKDCAQG